MSTMRDLLTNIENSQSLDAESFNALRRAFYADGHISPDEADRLFRINDRMQPDLQGWTNFFVSAITDFLLRQTPPHGHMNEAGALWLVERISHDGVLETRTELALVNNLLQYAESIPPRFEGFILEQVRQAVLKNEGALAGTDGREPGRIYADDVEILRRTLYAVSGDGGVGISRTEAEFMLELNDGTDATLNHESWKDLFVGCLANHLMAAAAPRLMDREEALAAEAWMRSDKGINWNFKNSFQAWLADIRRPQTPWALDHETWSEAEVVCGVEAAWLIERLQRDGDINVNEQALLEFLFEECPSLHESVKSLIYKAA